MAKEQWDVVAKLPAGAPTDQERLYRAAEQMLQNLLAEELGLKTHFVLRVQPVYNLVPTKGGAKLKISEGTEASFRFTEAGIEVRHQTMHELARSLFCPDCFRQRADRPVFDKTGIEHRAQCRALGTVNFYGARRTAWPETSASKGCAEFPRDRYGGTTPAKLNEFGLKSQ